MYNQIHTIKINDDDIILFNNSKPIGHHNK